MPKIFPVIRKVTVVQSGDIPAGASVMSDSVGLFARVTLPESLAGQADTIATVIAATYAETGVVPTETISLGVRAVDNVASQSETAKLTVLVPDSLAAALEAMNVSLAGFAEAVAVQAEALKAGVSGYADSVAGKTDSLAATTHTWANSNTTAGTAPTNPTNAQGQNNGTLANVKAGGVVNGTSTLTLTIPRANVPNTGTYTFRAYYRTNAGVADTFTLTYAQTGGTPATIDLPDGDFLTNPNETTITALHATNAITVAFTHAVAVIATGGSIDVDAVGIRAVNAF